MEYISPFAIESAFNSTFQEKLYEAERTGRTDYSEIENVIFESASQAVGVKDKVFDVHKYVTEKGFECINKKLGI